jgi:hypothetical protein
MNDNSTDEADSADCVSRLTPAPIRNNCGVLIVNNSHEPIREQQRSLLAWINPPNPLNPSDCSSTFGRGVIRG